MTYKLLTFLILFPALITFANAGDSSNGGVYENNSVTFDKSLSQSQELLINNSLDRVYQNINLSYTSASDKVRLYGSLLRLIEGYLYDRDNDLTEVRYDALYLLHNSIENKLFQLNALNIVLLKDDDDQDSFSIRSNVVSVSIKKLKSENFSESYLDCDMENNPMGLPSGYCLLSSKEWFTGLKEGFKNSESFIEPIPRVASDCLAGLTDSKEFIYSFIEGIQVQEGTLVPLQGCDTALTKEVYIKYKDEIIMLLFTTGDPRFERGVPSKGFYVNEKIKNYINEYIDYDVLYEDMDR